MQERIARVGSVRFEGDAVESAATGGTPAAATTEAAAAATPAAAGDGKPGDEVYAMGCNACHVSGAAGAPKTGDTAEWEKRMAEGVDALVQNAINGKGVMPAKGGLAFLSDADVANAVHYMLSESGVE